MQQAGNTRPMILLVSVTTLAGVILGTALLLAPLGGFLPQALEVTILAIVLPIVLTMGIWAALHPPVAVGGESAPIETVLQSYQLVPAQLVPAGVSDTGDRAVGGAAKEAHSVRGRGSRQQGTVVVGDDLLAAADIFQGLTREQRAMVRGLGEVRTFQPGEILGVQGSRGQALYVILSGQAELIAASPIGQLTVRIVGAGESLPLAALIGEGTLITSALALSEAEALEIPRTALLDLCSDQPEIGLHVFRAVAEILAGRYHTTLNRLTQTMDTALERSEFWANV